MSDLTLDQVEKDAQSALQTVQTSDDLEQFRILYLGKKGRLSALMEQLKTLPPSDRKDFGSRVNRLKTQLEEFLRTRKAELEAQDPEDQAIFDETLPAIEPLTGRCHPITQTIREICHVFGKLGFQVVDGPEIETDFYNFTALNIPADHPSRDSFDTFYFPTGHLLRSQTSTVQIRVMQDRKPPLKVIAPGRVYRPDTVDASHSFMFHQIEGLYVDQRVTFAQLKGVLKIFLRHLFGSSIRVRFRPHFFPFTEPSVEVDIEWGKKGWLEILGAGCVNPNVFKAAGYDPRKVRGFAFGLGVERIAMLRHGISDIRYFYDNDIRFLRQFS